MSTTKITEQELRENGVSALPDAPSTPSLYRGRSLNAAELRAAFDRLPRLLAERFNRLLDFLGLGEEEGEAPRSLADAIPTGITPTHTLRELLQDISTGALANYLATAEGEPLSRCLSQLQEAVEALERTKLTKDTATGQARVYMVSSAGLQESKALSGGAYSNTIPLRGSGGTLQVGTPTAASHAVTKAYVDGQLQSAVGSLPLHPTDPLAHSDLRQALSRVEALAKGAPHALGFANYQEMIQALNGMWEEDALPVGQSIFVATHGVPDVWVLENNTPGFPYEYVSDEQVVADLANHFLLVGRFVLAPLENEPEHHPTEVRWGLDEEGLYLLAPDQAI